MPMAKKDYYIIEKNVNKIIRGENTNFLDPQTLKNVISKLKGYNYKIYMPYNESEKKILYVKDIPKIRLLEIVSYDKLAHRNILGSLMSLNIDNELFGDIIITNGHYYIMIVDSIYDYILSNFTMIGNFHIKLKEVDLNILDNYERKYQEIEFIVSSLRIDNVISSIIGTSREQIKEKFQNEQIVLNYDVCYKTDYTLKENDVFSIRKYGKYRYMGIIKDTKKGNYLIKCNKYVDN